jgi:hypothetical protein
VQLITQPGQLVALGCVGNVALLVATVSQYRFAPDTLDQLKLGVVETPVAPLDGEESAGAGNSCAASPAGTQSRRRKSNAAKTRE